MQLKVKKVLKFDDRMICLKEYESKGPWVILSQVVRSTGSSKGPSEETWETKSEKNKM